MIVKMVELKNTMVTTVLMKKEPKDLRILCPFLVKGSRRFKKVQFF